LQSLKNVIIFLLIYERRRSSGRRPAGIFAGRISNDSHSKEGNPEMKKTALLVLPLALILAFDAAAAPAQTDSAAVEEAAWSGGWELNAGDNYIWRGIPCYENLVIQPDVWLTYKDFTLEFWSTVTTSEKGVSPRRHEINFILTHAFELKGLTIENVFNYYHYIHQPDERATGEWICTVGLPIGAFNVTSSMAVDVIEYAGAVHLEQGLSYETEIRPPVSLSTALKLGAGFSKFNDAYAEIPRSAFNYASWEGRMTWSMENGLYFQPYVLLTKTLDNRLKDAFNSRNTGFGLTVGMEY
jgi:hypothetical protein